MNDIRWKQRFANFDRAVVLLREPIERGLDSLSALEKEGMIQRFEFVKPSKTQGRTTGFSSCPARSVLLLWADE